MSDRRSQRGSFYGDKPSPNYNPRRHGRQDGSTERREGDKPVELGKEYKVRITDMSGRGEGVAKIEGFIVFIRGAKPGEEVTIRITRVGARAATGEIVPEVTVAAPATPAVAPAEVKTAQ